MFVFYMLVSLNYVCDGDGGGWAVCCWSSDGMRLLL